MRDMCEELGDGMCCEIICDLELQMRICNGESVNDLSLIPKIEKYIEYMVIILLKLPQTKKYSIGRK